MKQFLSCILALGCPLVSAFVGGGQDQPADAYYAELFSFPSKITLDNKQKEKLADLVKEYEKTIRENDKTLASYAGKTAKRDLEGIDLTRGYRHQVLREFKIRKNAILTDAQREALSIKHVTPDCVQEKALGDLKVWYLEQLEKHFNVLSRSYSPEEQVVTFVVMAKKKWSESERSSDEKNWNSGKMQAIFYNKDEEMIFSLSSPRYDLKFYTTPQITRTERKLTDEETREGLRKFNIRIDLAPGVSGELFFANAKKAASVKMVYPDPKE